MATAFEKPSPADTILSAGRYQARNKAPYFRGLLYSLVPRPLPRMMEEHGFPGPVGVNASGVMLYDPEYVSKLTAKQMGGILVHEIGHLWQKHSQRRGNRDPLLWNIAGDLTINPGVLQIGLELPPGGVFPKDFGFPEGEMADEYYRRLEQQQQGSGGKSKKEGPCAGQCGGCAGNPKDGEPDPNDADGGEKGRTEMQMKRLAKQASEAMAEHARTKQAGSVPAGWLKTAEGMLAPPKIPWRQKLSHAVRTASAYVPGATRHRYDGPSRRQWGLGYGPGCPVLPRLRTPTPKVAVVIDTSGSMGPQETQDALIETQGVLKAVGAEVDICTCDADVHELRPVRKIADVLPLLKGGGGTCFQPALDALASRKVRPDVIIFVTDGYCSESPGSLKAVEGARTIWVLVGPSVQVPAPWGEAIRVEKDQAHTMEEGEG